MKKPKGFTIIEVLIASVIILISLGVIYGIYQAELTSSKSNEKRIDAIDRLWIAMDKIKKDVREGKEFKSPSDFPISIPSNSLVFATSDTAVIAFYTSQDSVLYKGISSSTVTYTPIAPGVSLSSDATPSASSAQVSLTTSWTYRGIERQESISSRINLRNWGRE